MAEKRLSSFVMTELNLVIEHSSRVKAKFSVKREKSNIFLDKQSKICAQIFIFSLFKARSNYGFPLLLETTIASLVLSTGWNLQKRSLYSSVISWLTSPSKNVWYGNSSSQRAAWILRPQQYVYFFTAVTYVMHHLCALWRCDIFWQAC